MFIGFSAYAEEDKIYTYEYWTTATLEDVKRDVHDGVDINKFTNKYKERNVFIYAVMATKDPRIIQFLIDKGADLEIRTKGSILTPFLIAAKFAEVPEIIDVLIENGVDTKARAYDGLNALMLATLWQRNTEIITKLIESGFDVNEQSGRWNRTALMWGTDYRVEPGATNMMFLIKKHGANIDLKDDNGANAWHLIRGKDHFEGTEIYKYLQKHIKKN